MCSSNMFTIAPAHFPPYVLTQPCPLGIYIRRQILRLTDFDVWHAS